MKKRDERTMKAVAAAAADGVRAFDLLLPLCHLWADWLNTAGALRAETEKPGSERNERRIAKARRAAAAADDALVSGYASRVAELRGLMPNWITTNHRPAGVVLPQVDECEGARVERLGDKAVIELPPDYPTYTWVRLPDGSAIEFLRLLPDVLEHRPGHDLFWQCGAGEILCIIDGYRHTRDAAGWRRPKGRVRRDGAILVAAFAVAKTAAGLGQKWTDAQIISTATAALERWRHSNRDQLRTAVWDEVDRRSGKVPACFDGPILTILIDRDDGTREEVQAAMDSTSWTRAEVIYPDGTREEVQAAGWSALGSEIGAVVDRWCRQTGRRLARRADGQVMTQIAPPQPIPRPRARRVVPTPILAERDPTVLLNRLEAAIPHRLRSNVLDVLVRRHVQEIAQRLVVA